MISNCIWILLYCCSSHINAFGCFSKNGKAYWGYGGTDYEKKEELSGREERSECYIEAFCVTQFQLLSSGCAWTNYLTALSNLLVQFIAKMMDGTTTAGMAMDFNARRFLTKLLSIPFVPAKTRESIGFVMVVKKTVTIQIIAAAMRDRSFATKKSILVTPMSLRPHLHPVRKIASGSCPAIARPVRMEIIHVKTCMTLLTSVATQNSLVLLPNTMDPVAIPANVSMSVSIPNPQPSAQQNVPQRW